MKILGKQLFPLRNGSIFVELEVQGAGGDRISLDEQGLLGEVIFYSQAPKGRDNCVNCPETREVELVGGPQESAKTLYLIMTQGKSEGKNEEGRTASAEGN